MIRNLLRAHLRRRGPQELLAEPDFAGSVRQYATENGVSIDDVRAEVRTHLADMLASHSERATRSWNRFGQWMLRAHDVVVDEDDLVTLRHLDRHHSLALVFSHRSYLDGWVLPITLAARRFSPTYTFGGANLDLPFVGWLAGQTGIIFIRRATRDAPLYRLTLRTYIAHLVRTRANLAWSIEGGRTRTGKLRPPVHGILRYLADAADTVSGPDVMIVPVSIVYDQLHEVERMTREARGLAKRPEDLAWLVSLGRLQRRRLGRAYVTVGEPLALRERVRQLRSEGHDPHMIVERVGLEVSHRINRATPVTVTAVVCLALLGADRALTFDRVLDTVEPLADYIAARRWPVAGAATLTDRSTIRRALHELVASGVLSCYDSGTEAVWRIGEDQHLIAAFYRNTTIHLLVGRAIGEVALLAAGAEHSTDPDSANRRSPNQVAWRQALALRDLLKFDFFFPGRAEFEGELRTELGLLAPQSTGELTADAALALVRRARPHLAHLVLRPFIDAYLVVADRLVAAGDADLDDAAQSDLLTDALHVGRQWVLERRIASAESVSLELFRTALKLAGHRALLEHAPSEPHDGSSTHEPDLAQRRHAFLAEVSGVAQKLTSLARIAALADETPREPGDGDAAS